MLTQKKLNIFLQQLSLALLHNDFIIEKMVLFGSYSKGNPHANSDIDVAVWSAQFSGIRILDIETLAPIISKFHNLELHPFTLSDTALNNPFVAEILNTGKEFTYNLETQL
jgi:uncharacterized protein